MGDAVEIIPLFPLSHVLMPGMPLPLHIFEQRYRDLLVDVAESAGGASFGVVALRTGTEALTRDVRAEGPDVEPIGTVAEILEIDQGEDGSSDLLCIGSRRFRIDELVLEGKEYLRAAVTFLPEDDGALTAAQPARARELLDVYDEILVRLAGRATGTELPDDPGQLSYRIASRLPLPPAERQSLLAEPTAAGRLVEVSRLLRREIALLRGTRSIAVSPATLRMAGGVN
jgi:Lon protease-like protein